MYSTNPRRPNLLPDHPATESFDNLLHPSHRFEDDSSDISTYVPSRSNDAIELDTIHPHCLESSTEPYASQAYEVPKSARSKYLPLSSTEFDERIDNTRTTPNFPTSSIQKRSRSFWTPYTLGWPFLGATLLVSLALTLTVIFLLIYSAKNQGLGPDDGSSAILFGWHFAPTLVTVLYAVLTLMVLKDAQRTEPFAQMSHPAGATSESSLCRKEGFWWREINNSVKKSQNHGRVNYFILATVSIHTINTLLINTLSSSLLQSQNVGLQSQAAFTRYQASAEDPITMNADNIVYFQTISNILQNLTTSPWLTEKYAVVPFWPSSTSPDEMLSHAGDVQKWNATTTVLSVELNCKPMDIHYAAWSINSTNKNQGTLRFKSFSLTDGQGCQVGLNFQSEELLYAGGGSWFIPPNFTITSWDAFSYRFGPKGPDEFHNSTAGCNDRQVIFATNSSDTAPKNFTQALSCQSAFYSAEMRVGASTGGTATTVDVNDREFNASRTLLPADSVLNIARFETAFTNANWSSTLFTPDQFKRFFGGPLGLLAAMYDFDAVSLISSDAVTRNAQKIKQRFLGEMILASVSRNVHSSQNGEITHVQRRVVVNTSIAISLAVLLFLSTILMAIILYTSRKRPLNVHSDPTSVAAAIRLVDGNSALFAALHSDDRNDKTTSDSTFKTMTHFLVDGRIHSKNTDANIVSPTIKDIKKSRDWRPFVIRRSANLALGIFLILILGAIIALFILAEKSGLYEKFFTYQAVLSQADNGLFEFVPFSIVPTLVAVIISMWWTSFDEAFQRLQPFIAMAESAVPVMPAISLSYSSLTPIDALVRALSKKRWMIAVVSIAALLTQVLTVSMSALWDRAAGARSDAVQLTRTLEPRGLPFEYQFHLGNSPAGGSVGLPVLAGLYGHLTQNWLYSATLQLSYNGSEPGWSTDGWSFVPVDLSSITGSDVYKSTPANSSTIGNSSPLAKNVNVTLITPALRATLDCSPILSTSNLSSWLVQQDLTNATVWNVTKNPTDWKQGFEIQKILELDGTASFSNTPIVGRRGAPTCCANSTGDSNSASAIGYWSNNYKTKISYDWDSSSGPYPRNFTIKWVVGDAHPRQYLMNQTWSRDHVGVFDDGDYTHLIWPTAPQMSAINCRPRTQWTNASVTVDMTTLQVYSYTITDPIVDFDWPWKNVYTSVPQKNIDVSNPLTQILVSPGVLFQDAMMVASDLRALWPGVNNEVRWTEDLADQSFNFRLPARGLNADLMSYAMYQLAGGDLGTLTDHTRMTQLSTRVFSTFFQHFASYNVSAGGWAMQPITAGTNVSFTSDTRVSARVAVAVDVLDMSPLATYITLAILFILVLVTVAAYVTVFRHTRALLRHDFEDLASVVRVVYRSERIRGWVRGMGENEKGGGKGEVPKVHLGVFGTGVEGAGEREQGTWGIEIVDDGREPRRRQQWRGDARG